MRDLINWFLSNESTENLSDYAVTKVAKSIELNLISKQNLDTLHQGFLQTVHIPVNFGEVQSGNHYGNELFEIKNIFLKKKIFAVDSVVLHGSIITKDYVVGWSDLDSWVLLVEEKLTASALCDLWKACKQINRVLKRIDPLCHHSLIFHLDTELGNSNYNGIPKEVLERGLCIYGKSEIQFSVTDNVITSQLAKLLKTFKEFRSNGILFTHQYQGEYLRSDRISHLKSPYHFKYVVAMILNIPVMCLSDRGLAMYKGESFEQFYNEMSQDIDLIQRCEIIRLNWPSGVINEIPSETFDLLGENYLDETITILEKLILGE
jgi:hypothetical protein